MIATISNEVIIGFMPTLLSCENLSCENFLRISDLRFQLPVGTIIMARKRYLVLDAMRGVAAIAVVMVHIPEALGIPKPLSCGLAVDLFFLISGFVIEHAYGDLLRDGLGFWKFARLRIVRLYPVYVLGLVCYATFLLLRPGTDHLSILIASAFAALYLPTPAGISFDPNFAFPINPVSWSLFCELIVNLVYAVFFLHIKRRALISIICLSAIVLTCLMLNDFDTGGPWAFEVTGLIRASFSFFLGVLIRRLLMPGAINVPSWVFLLFLVPIFGLLPAHQRVYELVVILAAFPILLSLAARTAPENTFLVGLYDRLGALSYPNYVLHMPMILWISAAAPRLIGHQIADLAPWTGIAIIVIIAATAYFVDRKYDDPLRKYLRQRYGRVITPEFFSKTNLPS
jgi:peptidoglycan/LPS O-acetylase OafA/YrhL